MSYKVLESTTYYPCYCYSCGYMYYNDNESIKPCPKCGGVDVNVGKEGDK